MSILKILPLVILLASCGPAGEVLKALNPLNNGGVNANVQAGKTNTQTVGQSTVDNRTVRVEVRPVPRTDVPADFITPSVTQDTVTNNELPVWVWLVGLVLLVVGWVTDTPGTIIQNFRRK